MNERDEMRALVRAEYQATVSSKLVDDKLREAYGSLPEAPVKRKRWGALKWGGSFAGGLAAAFALLIGISAANPALAASIPYMENVVAFLKGGLAGAADPVIADGAVDDYVQPVVKAAESPFQITETYYDGKTLLFGAKMTMENAPEGYRRMLSDVSVAFVTEAGEIPFEIDHEDNFTWRMDRMTEDTFLGNVTMDVTGLGLPERFQVKLGLDDFTAVDGKLLVLSPVDKDDLEAGMEYREKTYAVEELAPMELTIDVAETPGLQKVYEVNQTQNGCTLRRVISTPALTEIDVSIEREGGASIVTRTYDSQGRELTRMSKFGQNSQDSISYTALRKDVDSVTVKFFEKTNAQEPIAEFLVPVERGWAEEMDSPYLADTVPVEYDPPLPKSEQKGLRDQENIQVVELGEAFTLGASELGDLTQGSMDVSFSNLRVYDSIEAAGVAQEDMLDYSDLQERLGNPENKFVLLDMTFTTHDAASYFEAVQEEESHTVRPGDSVFWICNYAGADMVDPNKEEAPTPGLRFPHGDLDYFSDHGTGISDYYHFLLGPNETKTVQVGYLIPKKQLELGNFQVFAICPEMNIERQNGSAVDYLYGGYVLDLPWETVQKAMR